MAPGSDEKTRLEMLECQRGLLTFLGPDNRDGQQELMDLKIGAKKGQCGAEPIA